MNLGKYMWKITLFALVVASATSAQQYRDSSLSTEVRVKDLLSRMTPEEKFWQLFMLADGLSVGVEKYEHSAFGFQFGRTPDSLSPAEYANQIQRHFVEKTRLGIPVILFQEALHGLVQDGTVSYPQAIGLAASFDTLLMHEVSAAVAEECRERGIRQVLSPVVNIASDVRWGRTEETYGEDPFLTSAMGVAFVSEFERRGIITTPKHLIANVGDGGRDSYPISLSERALRDIHLPPFVECIKRGGSRSVMTSYNSLDGLPCSASDWLNRELLKEGIGFPGFVISDACAVGGAVVLHFTATDYAESGEKAIESGLDVIFQNSFDDHRLFMPPFLDGRIPSDVIDRAVERVLRAKFELGLFDHPYVDTAARPASDIRQRRDLARQAAREACVLLKNDRRTLPVPSTIKSIAVIGPDAAEVRLGGYSGKGVHPVSILDGIKEKAGDAIAVHYAKGCSRLDTQFVTIPGEFLSCRRGDTLQKGLLGSYFDNVSLAGRPVFTRVDGQVQFQWTLFSPDPKLIPSDCYSVRWEGTLTSPASGRYRVGVEGNDGYRLYLDDSLVIDNWRKASFGTRLIDFVPERNRQYKIRLEYFEPVGNARIRLVWNAGVDNHVEEIIAEAVAAARASDLTVMAVGLEEGEFRDRASLRLPGRQEELIRKVAATGRPTVVLIVGGSAVTMSDWLDSVDAIIFAWYPGEEGGNAVADILFGDCSPSGRLPITFAVSEGQLPLVYNHLPTGRGDDYNDLTGQPLFPFGYGLSYTKFEYSSMRLAPATIKVGQNATVTLTVTNTGAREAEEVVQLYLRDELASVARPVLELKGFQRVYLKPGESREVTLPITPQMLTMLDAQLKPVIEPGSFRVMVGASSKDIRLHGRLTVTP